MQSSTHLREITSAKPWCRCKKASTDDQDNSGCCRAAFGTRQDGRVPGTNQKRPGEI